MTGVEGLHLPCMPKIKWAQVIVYATLVVVGGQLPGDENMEYIIDLPVSEDSAQATYVPYTRPCPSCRKQSGYARQRFVAVQDVAIHHTDVHLEVELWKSPFLEFLLQL